MFNGVKQKFDWLFSSHYKMERFGVTFGVLICLMVLLLTTIWHRKTVLEAESMGTVVMYSDSFSASLSGASGTVENIFCDEAQTQCFILLKFKDMSNVVTDASQYQIFLTGSNLKQDKQDLLSAPSATVYMFGVSGYMGIYLVDTGGFPSQILDLVVRCNKLTGPMPSEIPEYEDKSFEQYDQFRIYFNPGATDFMPANFMNMGRMSVSEIYDAMVVKFQEDECRDALSQCLVDMEGQLSVIAEYTQRVTDAGVIVPQAPIQIRGDQVVTLEDGRKALDTDYIMQGGYNFDWYHGSVKQGYASTVLAGVENTSSILEYIALQRQRASAERINVDGNSWTRTDGTEVDLAASTIQSDAMKNTLSNIQALKSAWNSYFELKKSYQTTLMENLLLLEQNLFDTSVNYSVNPGCITLW